MKLYMFRAYSLPIIRSFLLTADTGKFHRGFDDRFQAELGWNCILSWSCSKAVYKLVWHIPVPNAQWINSWWWAEELPETCRVSCRSKSGKLVHLVGFIIKKFVAMHGHMNVKHVRLFLRSIIREIWTKFCSSDTKYTPHCQSDACGRG